jgi:hypothetical protein
MSVCVDLPIPRTKTLELGFERACSMTQDAAANLRPSAVCSARSDRAHCAWCPAFSYVQTGAESLESPVPYLCSLAQASR